MTRLLVAVLFALAGCTAAPSPTGPPATVRTWTPATPFITTTITESR